MVKHVTARKQFVVVAYDIADDRRRNRVVRVLEHFGTRANYSVFECCVTVSQLARIKTKLGAIINPSDDTIIYYPICVNCFCKIEYQPNRAKPHSVVDIV